MKMLLNSLKQLFSDRKTKIYIMVITVIFFLIYYMLRTRYFYEIINYFDDYIRYYTENYLDGNIGNLIESNMLSLFIENDVMNIISAPFIYCVSHQSFIFNILLVIMPLIIFYLIHSKLYDEVHNGFIINKISRIGYSTYEKTILISNIIYGGLLAVLPKIIFYIFLSFFLGNGFSNVHFINNLNFIDNLSLSLLISNNQLLLVFVDLLMTFLYGLLISLISIIVIFLSKKNINSYASFILAFCGSTLIIAFITNIVAIFPIQPLFSYYSLYSILILTNCSLSSVIISLLGINIILFIFAFFVIRKKIRCYV